jgi:carbamoyltransferase
MNILGISAFYHDSAACLVRDGDIVAAAQEERFTRRKHDHRFPVEAIRYCLDEARISADQLNIVAFYDKPWIKFERLLETYLAYAPVGIRSFLKSMPLWLKEKLWMGERIRSALPGFDGEIIYPEHHQSHAASAFLPSPFSRSAIITMDGVGEWATASWGIGNGNAIDLKYELHFPHSLGLLYTAFTYYTGFRVNSGEYKVMGLAPYGEPKYVKAILDNIVDLKDDGSFRLNMKYFNYCQGLTMTSRRFHDLFGGPPRKPEGELTQRHMDVARSVQDITEEIMLRMARHVRRETGERNLCLAGGVALNCVGNGRILRENIFDNIWIQPAAGDAGGALGAALFAWYHKTKVERKPREDGRDSQHGSYLGPSWTTDSIEAWLREKSYPYHRLSDAEIIRATAESLADEKVVGWLSGRMEFGPRALGARSILGDARNPDMQSKINLKIKFRESFRPFAPAVLAEDVGEYFEIDRPSEGIAGWI